MKEVSTSYSRKKTRKQTYLCKNEVEVKCISNYENGNSLMRKVVQITTKTLNSDHSLPKPPVYKADLETRLN